MSEGKKSSDNYFYDQSACVTYMRQLFFIQKLIKTVA